MTRRFGIAALVLVALAIASPAVADTGAEAAASTDYWKYIGAAFAIGLAAAFGSLGQARGLAAAHALSLEGCKVTLMDSASKPGGMLVAAIPAYRLPRNVLQGEIDARRIVLHILHRQGRNEFPL